MHSRGYECELARTHARVSEVFSDNFKLNAALFWRAPPRYELGASAASASAVARPKGDRRSMTRSRGRA